MTEEPSAHIETLEAINALSPDMAATCQGGIFHLAWSIPALNLRYPGHNLDALQEKQEQRATYHRDCGTVLTIAAEMVADEATRRASSPASTPADFARFEVGTVIVDQEDERATLITLIGDPPTRGIFDYNGHRASLPFGGLRIVAPIASDVPATVVVNFTIEGNLTVPAGTVLNDDNTLTLPTGEALKIWETIELQQEDRDLNEAERNALGVVTGDVFNREMEMCEDV
jgi:hypothetical protein